MAVGSDNQRQRLPLAIAIHLYLVGQLTQWVCHCPGIRPQADVMLYVQRQLTHHAAPGIPARRLAVAYGDVTVLRYLLVNPA